jgi:hypothetical protein
MEKHIAPTVKAIIGLDPGGLDELGIAYLLPHNINRLEWKRKALWAAYPVDHIGRPNGCTDITNIRDFTSMKHHIFHALVSSAEGGVEVLSDGTHSLRLRIMPDERFIVDDRDIRIHYKGAWYEVDDNCGNHCGTESLSNMPGDAFDMTFNGTGILIYGPTDMIYGLGRVLIDDQDYGRFSQYPLPVDFPGMSRGYEKRYSVPLFEAHGLQSGEHTLRVEVTGERDTGAQGCYISLDKLLIESPEAKTRVEMIINSGFNYTRLVRGNYMCDKLGLAAGDSVNASISLVSAAEQEIQA